MKLDRRHKSETRSVKEGRYWGQMVTGDKNVKRRLLRVEGVQDGEGLRRVEGRVRKTRPILLKNPLM